MQRIVATPEQQPRHGEVVLDQRAALHRHGLTLRAVEALLRLVQVVALHRIVAAETGRLAQVHSPGLVGTEYQRIDLGVDPTQQPRLRIGRSGDRVQHAEQFTAAGDSGGGYRVVPNRACQP